MIEEKSFFYRAFSVVNLIILIIISLLCVLPMWYTLSVSLSSKAMADAGLVSLWPKQFTITSYDLILQDKNFFNAFWISVKRVVLAGTVTFFVVVLMAYPLSKTKKDFKGRNVMMWILIFCMMFNGGLVPWFLTVKALGLINSIWALVLSGSVPMFNVILVVNFIRNLPSELEEAAIVDGAGPWYLLFRIVIPLSVPVLATITLFTIVGHWNEFFQGLVFMTRQNLFPLQTYIQQLVVNTDYSKLSQEQIKRLGVLSNKTLNAAKIFIAMIPILVVYPFLQRYFITGITLGSVKG